MKETNNKRNKASGNKKIIRKIFIFQFLEYVISFELNIRNK